MAVRPGAATASSDADFARYGLDRHRIATWEDGARTDGRPGTYEWWYFDAHLDDGAKLVVVFLDKDFTVPSRPLSPMVRIDLDLPDGTSRTATATCDVREWSAATDTADVRVGPNSFTGDLHTYSITARAGDLEVDVRLIGTVPAWRPDTGIMTFGAGGSREFCWLPAVPEGAVEGSYTVDGVRRRAAGVGYHDHNWGNVGLAKVVHHWYWARGAAGPYTVIASDIIAAPAYGLEEIPVFMLARDGHILPPGQVVFQAAEVRTDEATGKPVADVTRYLHTDGPVTHEVTFTRARTVLATRMVDQLRGLRRLAARLSGFDGAYLRFSGELTIRRLEVGRAEEVYRDTALWELMYFGHAQ